MKTYNRWDIWLANVHFENEPGDKISPVLVFDEHNAFILSFTITSHEPRINQYWGEYGLINWEKAGLDKPSTVRLSKKVEIPEPDMVKCIGKLSSVDIRNIMALLSFYKRK